MSVTLPVCPFMTLAMTLVHDDFFHEKRGIEHILRFIHNIIIYPRLEKKGFSRFGSMIELTWTS